MPTLNEQLITGQYKAAYEELATMFDTLAIQKQAAERTAAELRAQLKAAHDTIERMTTLAGEFEIERDIVIEKLATVTAERDAARAKLVNICDMAERAAMVQDRSVGIIKQTCKIIADEARP